MKRRLLVLLALLAALPAAGDVRSDLAAATPFLEVVRAARAEGLRPAAITRALIEAGEAPATAAYGVALVWNECRATQEAVAAAVVAAGEAVEPVITIMAGLGSCGCSAQSDWARARQDARLRPEGYVSVPIELADPCECVTAAVEAAVTAVPGKADRIVRAAVEAAQTTSPALDSVGQRRDDEGGLFANVPGTFEPGIYRRRPDACAADRDVFDGTDLAATYERFAPGAYADIGRYANRCEPGALGGVVVTEFSAENGVGSYVELYNGSGRTVDFSADDYRLSHYHRGLGRRGASSPLLGAIPPGATYVLAGTRAPETVLRRADLLVPELTYRPGDALTIHASWSGENCRCAEAVVAASLRAPTADGLPDPALANMVHNKISRIYGLVPEVAPGQVLDALGQVDWHARFSADAARLPSALRRVPEACRGDSNELDAFAATGGFALAPEGELTDAGTHRAACRTAMVDLVISEFVAADGDVEILELHNPTPADIDLAAGGYALELYRPGDPAPFRVIDLRGNVEGDGNFLVATAEALAVLPREADLTVGSLDARESAAVVLKKLDAGGPRQCSVAVTEALSLYFEADFIFVDSPGDPGALAPAAPVVDPVASPN